MTMSTLMCPHCGGRLLIDPTLRLQSMLTCPYCARKSLMQKKNGMIVLRGIIASSAPTAESVANTSSVENVIDTVDETATTERGHEPVDEPVELLEPVVKTDESPEAEQPVETETEHAIVPDTEQFITPEAEQALEPEAEQAVEPDADRPVDPIVGLEAVPATDIDADLRPESGPSPDDLTPSEAAVEKMIPEEALKSLEPVTTSDESAMNPSAQVGRANEPDESHQAIAPPNAVEPAPVVKVASSADPKSRQEQMIALATRAADDGSIMAFNSYSRQAIDCDPTDPRMYVLRSRLIEKAHGFARATFLSPVWMSYTPRQKAFAIAQHFSSFNAAVQYSAEPGKTALADETGRLIAWQIREAIIENARLRLGKRPFNGRFHRQDLGTAPRIIDSLRSVNETVVPQVANELLRSIRSELDKLDPKLYYQLLRSGF